MIEGLDGSLGDIRSGDVPPWARTRFFTSSTEFPGQPR